MIHSMTGYGKSTAEYSNKKITVEIKSLNSRQFDMFSRIPFVYRQKELIARNFLSKELERGKIDLSITVERAAKDVSSKIDCDVLNAYYTDIKSISEKYNIPQPNDWFASLLRLPDVMKQDQEELDEAEWPLVQKALEEATREVVDFRKQEGEMLQKIFVEKIETIRQLLKEIEQHEAERIEKVRARIMDGLANLANADYDKNRFEQELIYYIEKLDVNEEKTRLENHLNYFIETLENETSQGKKLGFIVQEIGREINTLGSKSNHSAMQHIVVKMKDELEQIKEQTLNVL